MRRSRRRDRCRAHRDRAYGAHAETCRSPSATRSATPNWARIRLAARAREGSTPLPLARMRGRRRGRDSRRRTGARQSARVRRGPARHDAYCARDGPASPLRLALEAGSPASGSPGAVGRRRDAARTSAKPDVIVIPTSCAWGRPSCRPCSTSCAAAAACSRCSGRTPTRRPERLVAGAARPALGG